MKEIINSKLSSLAKKINEVKATINIEAGLKRTSFFEAVKNAFGKKFKDKVKPLCLKKDGLLIIACKNSNVTNELFMLRDDVLNKIQNIAKPLDITISDVIFSHKYWQKEETEAETIQEETETKIPLEELNKITITDDEIAGIKKAIEKNSFIKSEQKEKMLKAIILNLKEQKYNETKQ